MHLNPRNFTVQVVPANERPLLLRRPMPNPVEGFAEFLTRLCSENILDGPASLARRLGLTYGQLIQMDPESFRDLLMGRAKVAPSMPGQGTGRSSGRQSYYSGVRTQARVCPQCLVQTRYASRLWSWPLTLACDIHATWLLDACPHCQSEISFLRRRQFHCNCGFDYREAYVGQAGEWLQTFYEAFSPHRMHEPQDERRVAELEGKSLLILRSLLLPIDTKVDVRGRKVAGATDALLSVAYLGMVEEMMLTWPRWPLERITAMHGSHKTSGHRLLRQMKEVGSKELLRAVTSVSDALAQTEAIAQQARLNDPTISSISELVRITKLNVRTINKLLERGEFQAKLVKRKRGGNAILEMSAEESARIRKLYSSSVSLSEAAQKLSCHELHIKIFTRANQIKPVLRFGESAKTWRFVEDDLRELLASLQRAARMVPDETSKEQLIPLGRVAVKNLCGCPVTSWIRFANRIALHQVPVFHCGFGEGLNSLAVRVSDLPRPRGRG
jgi:hypothetical protein